MPTQNDTIFDIFEEQNIEGNVDFEAFFTEFSIPHKDFHEIEPSDAPALGYCTTSTKLSCAADSQVQPTFLTMDEFGVFSSASATHGPPKSGDARVEVEAAALTPRTMDHLSNEHTYMVSKAQPGIESTQNPAQLLFMPHLVEELSAPRLEMPVPSLPGTTLHITTLSQGESQDMTEFSRLSQFVSPPIPSRVRGRHRTSCAHCSANHLTCSGNIPCYECISSYPGKLLWSQPCIKASFVDTIELGSYFHLDKVLHQHGLLEKPLWISLVSVLTQYTNAKNGSPGWFTVASRGSRGEAFTCSIRADIIQQLANAVLKKFGNASDTIQPAKIGTLVTRKVITHTKKKPITEVMRLAPSDRKQQASMWECIIKFCAGTKRSIDQATTLALLDCDPACGCRKAFLMLCGNSDPMISEALIWLISRYSEIALFKYLQHSINGRDGRNYVKAKADAMLMFQILLSDSDLVSARNIYMLEKSYIDEIHPRQTFVRNILRRYCCIYGSKLPSWTDFWVEVLQEWPVLNCTLWSESFRHCLKCFDAYRLSACNDLDLLFNSFHPGREAVTTQLMSLCVTLKGKEAKHSKELFTNYFPMMALSQLEGFWEALGELIGFPRSLRAVELYPVRTFLALANLGWRSSMLKSACSSVELAEAKELAHQPRKRDALSSWEYLSCEVRRRSLLIAVYESALQISTVSKHDIQKCFTEKLLARFPGERELYAADGFEQSLLIAQRWSQLRKITGEMIVLCGSPFVDESLPYNIPMIVETGSDYDFNSLKAAILGDYSGIKDTCAQLQDIGTEIFTCTVEIPAEVFKSMQVIARDILGEYDPELVIARELRQMGCGLSARQVFDRMTRHGSARIDPEALYVCLVVISDFVTSEPFKSAAEFKTNTEAALQKVHNSGVATKTKREFYFRQIVKSLWI